MKAHENPIVMNSAEYLELKERMDRIEMKLDKLLGMMDVPRIEPTTRV